MALAAEVVVVDRPKHDAAQLLLIHVAGLQLYYVLVVVAHPLVVLEGVRSHGLGIRLDDLPLVGVRYALTDLDNESSWRKCTRERSTRVLPRIHVKQTHLVIGEVAFLSSGVSFYARTIRG